MSPAPVITRLGARAKKTTNPNITESVDTQHLDYALNLTHQTKMEHVLDSQQMIHDQGEVYLPRLTNQTDTQYTAYKTRASFPLLTEHVLRSFVGMALRKDLMLHNVPTEFLFPEQLTSF